MVELRQAEVSEDSPALRQAVIETALDMNRRGINVNKSGNVSVRAVRGGRQGFLITPTGVPYEALELADIVFVPLKSLFRLLMRQAAAWLRLSGKCMPACS